MTTHKLDFFTQAAQAKPWGFIFPSQIVTDLATHLGHSPTKQFIPDMKSPAAQHWDLVKQII